MSDQIQEILEMPRDFVASGMQFVRRCEKPDLKEFTRIAQAIGVGFLVMGFIGYIIKLDIPLNNVLVG